MWKSRTTVLLALQVAFCAAEQWPVYEYHSPVFMVAYSEVEDRGLVAVGAEDYVAIFDEDLGLLRESPTGASESQDEIKVLLFVKPKVLLACGSADRGKCRLYPTWNFKSVEVGDPDHHASYVGGRGSVAAFMTPAPGHVLYVARSYEGGELDQFGYALSSRVMYSESGSPNWAYLYDTSEYTSALNLHEHYRTGSHTRYLHAFAHGNFSYFLLTQRLRDDDYETRLARVCMEDHNYFSYAEVPLRCQTGASLTYDLATAAHLGPATLKLLQMWEGEPDDDVLYVTFGRNEHGQEPRDEFGSVLCAFPMSGVGAAFEEATADCMRGEPRTMRIKTILGTDTKCDKKWSNADENLEEAVCNPGSNHYLEYRRMLSGKVSVRLGEVVTSLAVTLQHSFTVAILGTRNGNLAKYALGKNPSLMYNVSLVPNSRNEVRISNAFDSNQQNLYLLAGNTAVKFPVGSCSPHPSCKSCITSNDPLDCGWCGDRCATRAECPDGPFTDHQCPPFIYEVYPMEGPQGGGTLLTIEGDNLGSRNGGQLAKISITVAGIPCDVIRWEFKRVVCRTGPMDRSASGPVVVNVIDTSYEHRLDINGTAVSAEHFTYQTASLSSVSPGFGPISGGTNLTLIGRNLDIGSTQSVTLCGVPCFITSNNGSHLVCASGRFSNSASTESSNCTVQISIDGNRIETDGELEDMFEVRPDPEIFGFSPNDATVRGGVSLTVTGRHLSSVSSPRLLVTVILHRSSQKVELVQDCFPGEPAGERLVCPAPSLAGLAPEDMPTDKAPLRTHVSFLMDGVDQARDFKNRVRDSLLLYHTDPAFLAFPGNVADVSIHDLQLVLKGKNLYMRPEDVVVTVNGTWLCNVTQLTSDSLRCKLPSVLASARDELFLIGVRTGGLKFVPGLMRLVEPPPEEVRPVSIWAWTALGMAFLVAGIFLVLYKLRVLGGAGRSRKPIEYGVFYERNPAGSNDYQGNPGAAPREEGACAQTVIKVNEETMLLLEMDNILFSRSCLYLEKVIGQGHFGRVYRGQLEQPCKGESLEVAVKTLHNYRYLDVESAESFLQEGLMMKDFRHGNVLTLIGVCFEDTGFPMVILPFMKHGDLKSYIQDEFNEPTIKVLIEFGIQVAEGMKYLSDLKFVHRDLAARNCMLDEDLTVKVADFGLSRDVYERDYYSSDNKKNKLPVKWMAPESLEKGTYSTKSDVWSFGVVLWELMTRGVTPYPEVGNWEILNYIKSGRRMLQPSYCPNDIYNFMLLCWHEDPRKRPSFSELASKIRSSLKKLENKQKKVGLEICYVNLPVKEA